MQREEDSWRRSSTVPFKKTQNSGEGYVATIARFKVVNPRSKVTFVISRHAMLVMHEFVQNMLNVAIPSERSLWLKGDRLRLEVRVPAS